jgi:hypothetical protein
LLLPDFTLNNSNDNYYLLRLVAAALAGLRGRTAHIGFASDRPQDATSRIEPKPGRPYAAMAWASIWMDNSAQPSASLIVT